MTNLSQQFQKIEHGCGWRYEFCGRAISHGQLTSSCRESGDFGGNAAQRYYVLAADVEIQLILDNLNRKICVCNATISGATFF